MIKFIKIGGVTEWTKVTVLKIVVLATGPGVRIPPPPNFNAYLKSFKDFKPSRNFLKNKSFFFLSEIYLMESIFNAFKH